MILRFFFLDLDYMRDILGIILDTVYMCACHNRMSNLVEFQFLSDWTFYHDSIHFAQH